MPEPRPARPERARSMTAPRARRVLRSLGCPTTVPMPQGSRRSTPAALRPEVRRPRELPMKARRSAVRPGQRPALPSRSHRPAAHLALVQAVQRERLVRPARKRRREARPTTAGPPEGSRKGPRERRPAPARPRAAGPIPRTERQKPVERPARPPVRRRPTSLLRPAASTAAVEHPTSGRALQPAARPTIRQESPVPAEGQAARPTMEMPRERRRRATRERPSRRSPVGPAVVPLPNREKAA